VENKVDNGIVFRFERRFRNDPTAAADAAAAVAAAADAADDAAAAAAAAAADDDAANDNDDDGRDAQPSLPEGVRLVTLQTLQHSYCYDAACEYFLDTHTDADHARVFYPGCFTCGTEVVVEVVRRELLAS
jgi:hypothetical protein